MDKNEKQDTNKPITFVLSDESVNSYGNVVLTEGIDTTAFERNPVMLYMHNRDGNVIGRWENIRKEDKRLLGDAVFDSTELAATVKKQVEKGFLRSVSIGIEVITIEDLNGVQTIVKSRLIEVSIVDIPSNKNAVKLCRRSGGYAYNLKELENDNTPEDLKAALIALLGLESGADDKDIIEAVKMALEGKGTLEEAVDEAITNGYIDGAQRGTFIALARGNRGAFRDFINGQRKAQAPEISRLINDAVNKRKLLGCETAIFERLGAKIGAKALGELLFTLRPMPKPMEFIKGGAAHSDRSQWTLDDYRKFAPQELENDPELYARLLKAEKGEEVTAHSLEWYRRNNPEYLREHPEVYRELLEQAKERQRKEARKNNK